MTKIKICGITNKADALEAVKLGVDMVGFVFYAKSKRYISPAAAKDIINELPPDIGKVGVFVDKPADDLLEIARDTGLDMLQFHGAETPDYCESFRDGYKVIKAFRLKEKKDLAKIGDYNVDFYLFDTYKSDTIGGTGKVFDWKILKDFEILKPFFLSGGLGPGNVAKAIKELLPFAVDVSTGVEASPGRKDVKLMKAFVENVRRSD